MRRLPERQCRSVAVPSLCAAEIGTCVGKPSRLNSATCSARFSLSTLLTTNTVRSNSGFECGLAISTSVPNMSRFSA